MEIPILKGILVIFTLSILVLFICYRLKIPAVVGYLLTGILAGPHGLELVNEVHEVEILAEIGIVLLLFTIGMEFSFDKLLKIKKPVIVGGTLQVALTCLIVFILAQLFRLSTGQALFIGFLISLSSTAIVLRVIQERAEVDSPHGLATLGILIFQDIIIVPMMLLTPILAGVGGSVGQSLVSLAVKGLVIILFVFVSTKWIVPQLLYQITRTKNRELFLLSVIATCLAIAWLTSSTGLSLALGAFLAGLIISESEYSHQALGSILPFRDVFTSFFFVSIGMLLNIRLFVQQPLLIIVITLVVVLIKAVAGTTATIAIGYPLRTSILAGLALSQVGEFSFILSRTGAEYGLLADNTYQMFLAVSILSMALTPFVIKSASNMANMVLSLPLPDKLKTGWDPINVTKDPEMKDHLIIIGYGINGKNLARAALAAEIPYLVLEMNVETVRNEQENGVPIFFGDATQEAILKFADITEARIVVIAISDPAATRRIIEVARRVNPKIYIIVRTRYIEELHPLLELGANEVVPEEFETSIEIFTRVLNKYMIPRGEIESFISEVRSDGYEMFRSFVKRPSKFIDLKLHIPDIEICSLRIPEDSEAAYKTLADLALRKEHGVTALAVRRGSRVIPNPHGDTELLPGDIVVVVGTRNKITKVSGLFKTSQGSM